MKFLTLIVLLAATTAFADTDVFVEGGVLQGGPNHEMSRAGGAGFITDLGKHYGLGFRYLNEGHPGPNYARDGFAVQGWYTQPITGNLDVQVGTGPYASMNNTTVDGQRGNDFRLGLLSSVALRWFPTASSWYVAAEYNNALVPGASMSNGVMLRVGNDFHHPTSNLTYNTDVSLWAGYSRTTQIGPGHTTVAYELEGKRKLSEHVSFSASLLSEGNSGLENRVGVTGKVWYDSRLSDRWTVSAGAGPYVYYDQVSGTEGVAAAFSLRGMYAVSKTLGAGLTYTRVASFSNHDQDIVGVGATWKF